MEYTIYRDLPSIAFVRCVSAIPGTRIHAEGTGFSVSRAIAKCRSEWIESKFQISHPKRAEIVGIAAHPHADESRKHAWNEALETLVLEQLAQKQTFYGFSLSLFSGKLCLGRVQDRFIALAIFSHKGTPTVTQAVSRNPFKAMLKAWSELRNVRIYNPDPKNLPAYNKGNRILSSPLLKRITVRQSFRKNSAATQYLRQFQVNDQDHTITYFLKETNS